MPKNKDLKRLIRSRKQKTGESYTAARAHILRQTDLPEPTAAPAAVEFAVTAGMSDDAVRRATGRNWAEWVEVLDRASATSLKHPEIARLLEREHSLDGWWAQTVTVSYERIRGLREIGQRRGGTFDANKSRTFPVSVDRLYRAFRVSRTRNRWLGPVKLTVRTATVDKSMRITWPDDTRVSVYFTAKGEAKSRVAIQHGGLADRDAVADIKQFWDERLTDLAALLC